MIYITGDCHADYRKFSTDKFPEQKDMSREDFVIICGDFGIWHDTGEERWWLKWLSEKPFTLLFVDGNHENFDRLYGDEFPIVDFHGGKAHQIRDNIFHLMRGYVFELEGKKFFAFGGASSHDIDDGILDPNDFANKKDFVDTYHRWYRENKMFRVKGFSWWQQEMPSEDEMEFGLKTLANNGDKVDYIITHCCPQHVASVFSGGSYKVDNLTRYFNMVAETTDFHKWYFGHYHDNQSIMGKFVLLYEKIERIL